MKNRESSLNENDERETLIPDEVDRAEREAENAVRQFDAAMSTVESAINSGTFFVLEPRHLLTLNSYALRGIMKSAGLFRQKPIFIKNSQHDPPPHADVEQLVREMCDYVNGQVDNSPIHICAYLMWRVNWIHPFVEGNGRTSRVVAYMMLLIRLGFVLPGSPTITEQISADKSDYYRALDSADEAWRAGKLDVSDMEELVVNLVGKQLRSAGLK